MRRWATAQQAVFERLGVEIGALRGFDTEDEPYFDRLDEQVDRLLASIDAAANGMGMLLDLQLNERAYLVSVVATIFVPLTFVTGFFGMNFGWMVDRIDSPIAFWPLGIAIPVAAAAVLAPGGAPVPRRRLPEAGRCRSMTGASFPQASDGLDRRPSLRCRHRWQPVATVLAPSSRSRVRWLRSTTSCSSRRGRRARSTSNKLAGSSAGSRARPGAPSSKTNGSAADRARPRANGSGPLVAAPAAP